MPLLQPTTNNNRQPTTNNQQPTTDYNNRHYSRTALSRTLPELYLCSLTDACCIKLKMCKKYKDGKRRHRNKFESANALPDYGVEEWRDGAQGKYYIPSNLSSVPKPSPSITTIPPFFHGYLFFSGILWTVLHFLLYLHIARPKLPLVVAFFLSWHSFYFKCVAV